MTRKTGDRKRSASTSSPHVRGAKRRSVTSLAMGDVSRSRKKSPTTVAMGKPTTVAVFVGNQSRYETRSQTRRRKKLLDETPTTKSAAASATPVKSCRVYTDGGCHRCYSVTLARCNIENNQNNFYQIQVLEYPATNEFHVVFKHGRIGHVSTMTSVTAASCTGAKELFHAKFHSLTKNKWARMSAFQHVDGCYDLVEVKIDDESDDDTTAMMMTSSMTNHQLCIKEKSLMKLILGEKPFSAELFRYMSSWNGRTPLGRISRKQVDAGYACLKRIRASKYNSQDELMKACNNFYTKIPHFFSKQRKPTPVRGDSRLKEKSLLLDTLADPSYAKLAQLFQRCGDNDVFSNDIVDIMYKSLKYRPCHLDRDTSPDYTWIEKCVTNTHGHSHNWYTLQVTDVYELNPRDNYDVFRSDLDNRFMLWHGSRLTNWHGILRNGLRIEPVEAISSGSMFGSGVYFADMVSKAANYCQPSYTTTYTTPVVGLLLLCEVALGSMTHRFAATQNSEQAGPHPHDDSVMGVGQTQPNPEHRFKLKNGAIVHSGKPCVNETAENVSDLMYNEYVVYKSEQIRPAYIVQVTFES